MPCRTYSQCSHLAAFRFFFNNFIHVVECPCGLVVKLNVFLFTNYNIVTLLVFKTISLYCIKVDGTTTVYCYKPILLCTKNVFVLFLSGVPPAWRLI